jgi:hypothetical protein
MKQVMNLKTRLEQWQVSVCQYHRKHFRLNIMPSLANIRSCNTAVCDPRLLNQVLHCCSTQPTMVFILHITGTNYMYAMLCKKTLLHVITFRVTRWVLGVWLAGFWSFSLDHTWQRRHIFLNSLDFDYFWLSRCWIFGPSAGLSQLWNI